MDYRHHLSSFKFYIDPVQVPQHMHTMHRLASTHYNSLRRLAGATGPSRHLCAEAKTPKSPKLRGNSEYVKRRLIYRYDLHERRIAFRKKLEEARTDVSAREEEEKRRRLEVARAKEERKRYVRLLLCFVVLL